MIKGTTVTAAQTLVSGNWYNVSGFLATAQDITLNPPGQPAVNSIYTMYYIAFSSSSVTLKII